MLDSNDHRNLGQRLDLFHFQEEAPGMVFWHPRGFAIYRAMEEAMRRRMKRDGFVEVRTPQVLRRPIWEASGHWQNFSAGMMLLAGDELPAAMKPVSCPGHLELVRRMNPSYRELPLRIGELGLCHRNEQSGVLQGLFRLRQFTQDDGHIFCSEDQIESEISKFCASLRALYRSFGFEEVAVGFSTRPPVRAGSDEVWDRAESMLMAAAKRVGLECQIQPGEGAFYGPKLEFVLRDCIGRSWQCGTIQLDLVLPERFDVSYIDSSGARKRPAMLHRALLGSLERFLGIVLEQHRGLLPGWLAAEQVVVAPVAGAHAAYAQRVAERFERAGLRVRLDARAETLARRMVDAREACVPFVAVAGAREEANGEIAIKKIGGGEENAQHVLAIDAALEHLREACRPPESLS